MTNNFSNECFYGKYRAIVVDNRDPLELGRVKLQVAEVFGSLITDWASPCSSMLGGFADGGFFTVPPVGSGVWCEFEHGNVEIPVYAGSWWGQPSGINEVPKRARGIDDEVVFSKGNISGETLPFRNKFNEPDFETDTPKEIIEPPSPFEGEYPDVRILKTPSGHVLEFDDTKDKERVLLYHKQGSLIEFRKDGDAVFKTKKRYDLIDGEHHNHIRKQQTLLVEESQDITIKGQYKSVHEGLSRSEFKSDKTCVVRGKLDQYIDADKIEEIGGTFRQIVDGPIKRNVSASITDTIGSQFERAVIQTSHESIANQLGADVAKSLDILIGDYTVDIEVGSEKHTLTFGDVEWTLLFGSETHTLEFGNVTYTLIAGDWKTEITTGDASWIIETGSERHRITLGDFIVRIATGDIALFTDAGDISLTTSAGSIDITSAAGPISLLASSSITQTAGTTFTGTAGSTMSLTAASLITLTAVTTNIIGLVNLGAIGGGGVLTDLNFHPYISSHVHYDPSNSTVLTGVPTVAPIPGVNSSFTVRAI